MQRALIAGDAVLGASVFQLVAELDAGDVFAMRAVELPATATAGEALEALALDGAALTADVVAAIADGSARAVPQEGEPTFAGKLTLEDGLLDFREPFDAVYARFRGVTPEPGAHTTIDAQRLKILEARPAGAEAEDLRPGAMAGTRAEVLIGTATSPLAVTRLQPAGKGPMNAADWWRGLQGMTPVAGS
ncbi:methionyl-tRNA formyltransferase [Microbacterium paraoxydans]|uniref:methionyl-tRNA formyltransferase n=1 Tax=Microbacterium paraoxydans TaxID=199592 RepID=UPI003D706CC6